VLVWSGHLSFTSDPKNFFYKYTRELRKDGNLLKTKTWEERIPSRSSSRKSQILRFLMSEARQVLSCNREFRKSDVVQTCLLKPSAADDKLAVRCFCHRACADRSAPQKHSVLWRGPPTVRTVSTNDQ